MSTYPYVRAYRNTPNAWTTTGDGLPLTHKVVPADAIVIDRAELPEVVARPGYSMVVYINGGVYSLDIEARRLALEFLALAEYLAAHPPVPPVSDEDVETLAEAIFTARWQGLSWEPRAEERKDDYRAQSRRLLATGRVSVRHE